MTYEVQIIRTRRDYLILEIEAESPELAKQTAARKVKEDKYIGELDFCDGETTGHSYKILSS